MGPIDIDSSGCGGERRDERDERGAERVRDGGPVTGRLEGIRAAPRGAAADSVGAATDACDKLPSSGFDTRPVCLSRTSVRKDVTVPAATEEWQRCIIKK